jgi:hypothetical protein
MDDVLAEIYRVWLSFHPYVQTLLAVMLVAFVFACIRSARMSLAKLRRLQSKTPKAIKKIGTCPAGTTHNFPVVKRGRTVKCRNCPATFTRR